MKEEHLKEFGEFLKLTKGLQPKSVADYLYWAKGFDVEKLSQDYIDSYAQKRGNNSGVRGMLLNFFEFAGLKKTYDMPPKKSGRQKKRLIRGIAKEEIDAMRSYLYEQSFKKGLIFDLMYQGALRRSEVPTIRINSFKWLEWLNNMDAPCKLIILGKGNKERTVLIDPEIAEMIFQYYHEKYGLDNIDLIVTFANAPNLMFPKNNKPMPFFDVWEIIHKASKHVLNRPIKPHELRHARASYLEKIGVPVQDIKNYLGHASLSTTEIYLHRSEKESIDNIQNILNQEEIKDKKS